jgi:glycosyltransferase domain-containing protein
MHILSKLTLVLFTYNRQDYALRNMRYWSGRGAKILVLDGTDQAIDSVLLEELESNIKYHHLPISIHERLAYSITLIEEESEFVALYGDDEFFSQSALENCIVELEKDPSLVSCMGRTIGFNPTENGLIGRSMYNEMKDYILMQDDPIDRMVAHMGNYTSSTIYSVIRTPVWKRATNAFVKNLFNVFSIEEYIFEMVVTYMGKSKVIPVLYWFRSLENERIIQNDNKFNIWWNSSECMEEKELFINLMVNSLSCENDIDKIKLRKGIIKTGDAFTVWANELAIGAASPIKGRSAFLSRLFTFGIWKLKGLRSRFNKFWPQLSNLDLSDKKKMQSFDLAIRQLKKEGVQVNDQEISEIEQIVMNFYNSKLKKDKLAHE